MAKLVKYKTIAICFAFMLGAFSAAATAAPITMWSGDGGDVLEYSVVAGAVTLITPHTAWGNVSVPAGLPLGTAQWISYANTGVGGTTAPNVAGRAVGQETMHFSRAFTTTGGAFDVWILSDDTAAVQLTKSGGPTQTLYFASGSQLDPCAGAVIGCAQQHMGQYSEFNLAAGTYSLDFFGFQTNGDVSGMNYAFRYQQARQVPEPTSLGLLGLGLVFTASTVRRRVLRR